jgi:Cu2+-exporting ATPase
MQSDGPVQVPSVSAHDLKAAPLSVKAALPRSQCLHCGQLSPRGQSYCCRGCEAVHGILLGAGLQEYYRLRDTLGVDGRGGAPATGAAPIGSAPIGAANLGLYAYLDDPAIQQQFAMRPGEATLRIVGLQCVACVWLLERLPALLPGIAEVRVSVPNRTFSVRYDATVVSLAQIAALAHTLGYELVPRDHRADVADHKHDRGELLRLAIAGACATNVMLVSIALYSGDHYVMDPALRRLFQWAALVFAIPSVTYGAWPFYRGAWAGLRLRRLHIDLPTSLGFIANTINSVVATVQGRDDLYFDSVTALIFLLLVGRYVQARGTRLALSQANLMQLLLPLRAQRWLRGEVGGQLEWTSIEALRAGDRIRVAPEERFAADGIVVAGRSNVDASSFTGEAMPARIEQGVTVLAGTVNLTEPVDVEVRAAGVDSRIGALACTIQQAGEARSRMEMTADRISGYFVAALLSIAALTALGWWWFEPSRMFSVVVALLVVACPCALGLATPTALSMGRAQAAKRGILLRSAEALERLAGVRTIALDKTGTLTEGHLEVRSAQWLSPAGAASESELRGWVTSVEGGLNHPIARALVRWATSGELVSITSAEERRELAGQGVEAIVAGRRLWIGRAELALEAYATTEEGADALSAIAALSSRMLSPVAVCVDGRIVVLLGLGDSLRANSKSAIASMREMGIEPVLLSGDHPEVVRRVAAELGIARAYGGLTPEQKAEQVKALEPAAMVGDGINDALALRAARVGIAVRGGAEVAMQVADIHLATGDMDAVVESLRGSRRTLRVVRRNLAISVAYNMIFGSLAIAGMITPLAAALLMPVSSLTVLGSAVWSRMFFVKSIEERRK